ncbi:hypothetical protein P692DRAFT_20186201 [Suillus brevipes Sb2]|nr:hypothetical protein P692DRAFT_20186201 [Suillus brevipes Sb2]
MLSLHPTQTSGLGLPGTCRYCFCAVFTSCRGTMQCHCQRRLSHIERVPRYLLESMTPVSIFFVPQLFAVSPVLPDQVAIPCNWPNRVAKMHLCVNQSILQDFDLRSFGNRIF